MHSTKLHSEMKVVTDAVVVVMVFLLFVCMSALGGG